MEKKFAAFTVFTFLLFAVSSANPALIPYTTNDASRRIESKSETVPAADPNILLPSEKPNSEPVSVGDEADAGPLGESDQTTTQVFTIDTVYSTPSSNFARFHPINRHFLDRPPRIPVRFINRHPCRLVKPFVIPRTEISFGNDMILSDKTDSYNPEKFHRQVPSKWMRFKHHDGLRRHHSHHHDHDDHDHNHDDEERQHKFMPKYIFDREKLQSLSRRHHHHQKEMKKREHEVGFMKSIRKFLKHTFD